MSPSARRGLAAAPLGARPPARRSSRTAGPGSSAARSATPRSAGRGRTSTSRSARATRSAPPARSRGSAGGPAFQLSAEFATWRAVAPDGRLARRRRPRCAARRSRRTSRERDFTVNAVAVPLAGGDPIDPTGGCADLEARLLRAVSERSFERRPAAAAARRPARRRASASRSSPGPRSSPAPRPRRRPSRPASASSPSCAGSIAGAGAAAGPRADGRARGHRRRSCPSSRRCAASCRTRTTTSTSTATRSTCSRSGSASRATSSASPGICAPTIAGIARRAARRRAHPRRGAALRRALPRPRQAGDALARRAGYVTFIGHDAVGARDHRRASAGGCGPAARLSSHLQATRRSTTCASASWSTSGRSRGAPSTTTCARPSRWPPTSPC